MRWLLIALGFIAVLLQAELWISDSGFQKTRELREAVERQRELNQELVARNAAVFDDGKTRVALVGIDALAVPRHLVVAVRKEIEAKCGIRQSERGR